MPDQVRRPQTEVMLALRVEKGGGQSEGREEEKALPSSRLEPEDVHRLGKREEAHKYPNTVPAEVEPTLMNDRSEKATPTRTATQGRPQRFVFLRMAGAWPLRARP